MLLAVVLVVLAALLAAAESAVQRTTRGRAAQPGRGAPPRLRRAAAGLGRQLALRLRRDLRPRRLRVVRRRRRHHRLRAPRGARLAGPRRRRGRDGRRVVRAGGRQPPHPGPAARRGVALAGAPVLVWLARVLGPVARLLVLLGNAVTPGKGYRDGPFSDESEPARACSTWRGARRHRGRRAADAALGVRPGRHDRPRGHGAAHRHGDDRPRQGAAAGAVAVPALRVLPHPRRRRRAGRRARRAVPQGRDAAGLPRGQAPSRPCRCARSCDRCTSCRRASRSTTCCARCSATRTTSPSWSTSTAAPPGW
nr:hypothetical protein [Angustibacter aerolatus]